MSRFLSLVSEYDAYFLVGLSVLSLILIICVISLSAKLRKMARHRQARLEEGSVEHIIDSLADQARLISDLQRRIEEIAATHQEHGKMLPGCLQRIGMTRFNAFEDVGGEQSFALALLDASKNGVVVSSLYGRQESRLYAKSIVNGRGERALSDEERRALESAG